MEIRDLLGLPDLGLRPVAGLDRMDRSIRWVYTTDLPDPRRYLSGGELVLTSGTWYTEPADSERFVAALADGGALGLIAGFLGRGETPTDLRLACDRHSIPLFEVPEEVSFGEISETVIGRIIEERGMSPGRSRRLLAAVATSSTGLVETLAAELSAACGLFTITGRPVARTWSATSSAGSLDARVEECLNAARGQHRPVVAPEGISVFPVIGSRPRRLLMIEGDYRDWPIDERNIADEVCRLLAVELAREHDHRTPAAAYAGQLLKLLLDERAGGEEIAAVLRAARLEKELPITVVAARLDPEGPDAAALLAELAGVPFVAAHGEGAIAFVPGAGEDLPGMLREIAGRLAAELDAGERLMVGVGGTAEGITGLRSGLEGAGHALVLAGRQAGPVSVASGADVESFVPLLLAVPDSVRRAFRSRLLQSVFDYDTAHRSELIETLRLFLETSGSWQSCAEGMHVHVNTVRYRIQRVEKLTGRDLSTLKDRIDLYLALNAPS
ncbi:MAG: hypothetical protein QOE54_7314 [Streptosporangiaceae bacterium]|nr:hypothetical protein [Streptosporangiaceae bacterium]